MRCIPPTSHSGSLIQDDNKSMLFGRSIKTSQAPRIPENAGMTWNGKQVRLQGPEGEDKIQEISPILFHTWKDHTEESPRSPDSTAGASKEAERLKRHIARLLSLKLKLQANPKHQQSVALKVTSWQQL